MKSMKLKAGAHACTILMSLMLSHVALADTESPTATRKSELENQKLELEIEKGRIENRKALIPDLTAYKREAPSAVPEVAATTSRYVYLQTQEVAKVVVAKVTGLQNAPKTVLLDSPNLLSYQSDAEAVKVHLATNSASVASLTSNLKAMIDATLPPPQPTGGKKKKGGGALVGPLIQAGFSIAEVLRTRYAIGGTTHEALTTKLLQAQVIGLLSAQSVKTVDVDAALVWPSGPEQQFNQNIAILQRQVNAAKALVKDAADKVKELTDLAKSADPKGDPDPEITAHAEKIAAQAKELAADADKSTKYLLDLHTPGTNGLTPVIAAKRGLLLADLLTSSPPRLKVSSIAAATDIVAADGWFKGLRVGVAGNTIVEWRLDFPDGRVEAGTAQSCNAPSDTACAPVVLSPDKLVP